MRTSLKDTGKDKPPSAPGASRALLIVRTVLVAIIIVVHLAMFAVLFSMF